MKNLFVVYLFAFGICLAGCVRERGLTSETSSDAVLIELAGSIQNQDVKWDGTYVGLEPTLLGASNRLFVKTNGQIVPLLIEALSDKRRYVAAHVLLTKITGNTCPSGTNS